MAMEGWFFNQIVSSRPEVCPRRILQSCSNLLEVQHDERHQVWIPHEELPTSIGGGILEQIVLRHYVQLFYSSNAAGRCGLHEGPAQRSC